MNIVYLRVLICFLLLPGFSYGQRPAAGNIDSAKAVAERNIHSDSAFINASFYIAEKYMMRDMYDSCQVWLNHIAERVPLRKPSYFNFYLSTYQASNYYYTGLIRMALQEGERMWRIARELNDSILIGSSYNLIGLSYMNMDSVKKAVPYFIEGIRYIRQPPYEIDYFVSSKPHHLYGNLAKCYLKLGMYEKAKEAAVASKRLAAEISWIRGVALADNTLGLVYAHTNQLDSALFYEREAISIGIIKGHPDVSLISYSALAESYALYKQQDSALANLNRGFLLMKQKQYLNDHFVKQFLTDAIRLSSDLAQPRLLIRALQLKDSITNSLVKKNDVQISLLVKGSVANEMRAAKLEVAEARQKQSLSATRLILALVALGSMVIVFFLYRHYQQRQLKEIDIRNKISRDLHDDIGATLSSIKIYGELANSVLENKPDQSKSMITKITEQSNDLMHRMGDVIWSMKSAEEIKNSLTARIKNYSSELLSPKEIACSIDIDENLCNEIRNPITRKNLLLIIKEALNNIAKYSGATEAGISFREDKSRYVLSIFDNGKGFKAEPDTHGNGLVNMKQRCEQLGGNWMIESAAGKGVTIICTFTRSLFSKS